MARLDLHELRKVESSIALGANLDKLIDNSHGSIDRKKISDGLGVSASTVSRWIKGGQFPSLVQAAQLAVAFQMPVDDLLFREGRTTSASPTLEPWIRHFSESLLRHDQRSERKHRIVAQIASRLIDHIEEEARKIALESQIVSGFITDEESMMLEECSNAVDIVSMNLHYEIMNADGAAPEPGSFLRVTCENLQKGCHYRHLLPNTANDSWKSVVGQFKKLMMDMGLDYRTLNKYSEFRVAKTPLFVGIGFLKLDMTAMMTDVRRAVLYDRVSEFVNVDGELGYVISPSTSIGGDPLLDQAHFNRARASFDAMWQEGRKIG